jgi:hypothetical protein
LHKTLHFDANLRIALHLAFGSGINEGVAERLDFIGFVAVSEVLKPA